MSLDDLRKQIDEIDRNIVEMIAKRVKVASDIGQENAPTVN